MSTKIVSIANNCKALSENELAFMNEKYEIWLEGANVCVKCKNRARVTYHSRHEKFSINVKRIRKITYSVDAIDMFDRFLKDEKAKKFTLTDIQNALNVCRLTYQELNDANVLLILNKNK